jgi:hypothetical protein
MLCCANRVFSGVVLCSEGGLFNCKLKFPDSYPDRPPKMKFVTPIWHPNGVRRSIDLARSLSLALSLSLFGTHTFRACGWIDAPPSASTFVTDLPD